MAAIFAATALVVGAAGPVGAQEIPDVPELGFMINPLEGPVGSFVVGNVNVADVEEHCATDVETLQEHFAATDAALGPMLDAQFPSGLPEFTSWEDFAITLLPGFAAEIAGDAGLAGDVLPQTFVMAFADLATASPIEPMGNFDPSSGVGQVGVPEIVAGVHPVIATCVAPTTDPEALAAAVSDAAVVLEAFSTTETWLEQCDTPPPFPWDLNTSISALFCVALNLANGRFPASLAEDMVVTLMEPRALGFEFYCVFDDTGVCPVEDFDPTPPEDFDIPAEPVTTTPRFTG